MPPVNPPDYERFWDDGQIGADDVTLPSLPAVDVPVIEDPRVLAAHAVVPPVTSAATVSTGTSSSTGQPGWQTLPEHVTQAILTAPAAAAVPPVTVLPGTIAADTPPAAPTPVQMQTTDSRAGNSNWFGRMREGLSKSRKNLAEGMANILIGGKEIDDELLEEVETQLLVADIGVDATRTIIQNLTERSARRELIYSNALYKALQEELVALLAPKVQPLIIDTSKKPYVILMVGVNGVGKTTTIGKLAKRLQLEGRSVMLAAGDTFRAAATEQLKVWGERNGIPVVAQGQDADSASVIFDAMQSARARGIDVLIADTAGRLHNKSNLMEELAKVRRVLQKTDPDAPHEAMIVVDAGTGQNALNQVQHFNEAIGLTGITVTKLDGTAKGGVLFNIAQKTDIPIRFIGVGEKIDDLQPFSAKSFVAALFQTD